MNIPEVLGTAFYRTALVTAFELHFGIQKEFKEKKVSGEIAFALIGSKHEQIQKPASRSTTLRTCVLRAKFAEFYYDKKSGTRSP